MVSRRTLRIARKLVAGLVLVVLAACSERDQVTDFENPDRTPPGRIGDLRVFNTTVSTGTIGLQWTSPGDDGHVGVATGYQLRWSTSAARDFSDTNQVAVLDLGGPAQPSGANEQVSIAGFIDLDATYYLRLYAYDETYRTPGDPGRGISDASNLVVVRFATVQPSSGFEADFSISDQQWTAISVALADTVALGREEQGGSNGAHVRAGLAGAWWWSAHATVALPGDFGAVVGGTLAFDTISFDDDPRTVLPDFVRLIGTNETLIADLPVAARTEWSHYAFALDTSGQWRRASDDAPATVDDVQSVLATLRSLEVRGDLAAGSAGVATSGLDRVRFGASFPFVPIPVLTTFEGSAEGWTVSGSGLARYRAPVLVGEEGVEGGYVAIDTAPTSYWIAPSAYRGDLSTAYGDTLAFYVLTSVDATPGPVPEMVVLEGGGHRLTIDADVPPGKTWSPYAFVLSPEDAWMDARTGQRAAEAQILATLRELGLLKIRASYPGTSLGTVTQRNGLDSVSILKP